MKTIINKKYFKLNNYFLPFSLKYKFGAIDNSVAQVRFNFTFHSCPMDFVNEDNITVRISNVNGEIITEGVLIADTAKNWSTMPIVHDLPLNFINMSLDKESWDNKIAPVILTILTDNEVVYTEKINLALVPYTHDYEYKNIATKMNLQLMAETAQPRIAHQFAEQNGYYDIYNYPGATTYTVYVETKPSVDASTFTTYITLPSSSPTGSFNIGGRARRSVYRVKARANVSSATMSQYGDSWVYKMDELNVPYMLNPSSRLHAASDLYIRSDSSYGSKDFEGSVLFSYGFYHGDRYATQLEYSNNHYTSLSGDVHKKDIDTPFIQYVGEKIEIVLRAYTSVSGNNSYAGTYYSFIGSTYNAGSAFTSTSSLIPSSTVSIRASNYDGYSIKYGSEVVRLQYRFGSDAWRGYSTEYVRGRGKTRGFNDTIVFDNIYGQLMNLYKNNYPTDFSNRVTKRIYFRTSATFSNGDTSYSASDYIDITPPAFEAEMIKADGSTSLKFPMNKTSPVTKDSFTLKLSVNGWSTNLKGTLKINAIREDGVGGTFVLYNREVNSNFSNLETTIYLNNFSFVRNKNYKIFGELYTTTGTTVLVKSKDVYWSEVPGVEIRSRNIELQDDFNVSTELVAYSGEFIDPKSVKHQSLSEYVIKWDANRAFLITDANITIQNREGLKTTMSIIPNYELFSTTETMVRFVNGRVLLSDNVNTQGRWDIMEGTILGKKVIPSPAMSVKAGARGIFIDFNFTIREAFRNSPISSVPIFSAPYLGSTIKTISFSYEAHTVSLPIFDEKIIEIKRYKE